MDWRLIPSFPDYEINAAGDVRRVTEACGAVVGKSRRRVKQKNGYNAYGLRRAGRTFTVKVCWLVAEAFIGPRPVKADVCHADGDHLNDHANNLRYDTRSANNRDKRKHGRVPVGEKTSAAKLTDEDIEDIRALAALGHTQRTIAPWFGLRSHSTVGQILRGKSWSHV